VSRAGVDGTAVGGAAVGGAGVGGALGSSVAAVEAAGWSDTVAGSLKAGLRWSTAMAAVVALAASAPAVVAAAVVDATVCVDFFLRSHSSRFCLRLWLAGRCLPCFLGALAAVEVWHTSRVSSTLRLVCQRSLNVIFTGNFSLRWCSNFVGSESSQKQSVQLLQIWSTTQLNTPPPPTQPSPQSHRLSVYT
jgi:hypothetical protein